MYKATETPSVLAYVLYKVTHLKHGANDTVIKTLRLAVGRLRQ